MHLDSGNTGHTVISKAAFDFMGLARTAKYKGTVMICGITGPPVACRTYEIHMSLDVVNSLKPGTVFQRPTIAAVHPQCSKPGRIGHFDVLVNATDSQKFK